MIFIQFVNDCLCHLPLILFVFTTGEYFKGFFTNLTHDYKSAVVDMVQDMQQAPKKATFYLSLLASGIILAKTSPSEADFHAMLSDCHHDLILLGEPIRNRLSDTHVRRLQGCVREGTLRYTNCGFFSLVWEAGYDQDVNKFEAQCGLVKPRWLEFHRQIVDVGVLGRWYYLTQAMVEYDVNVDEWDKQGHKVKVSSASSLQGQQATSS